MSADTNRRWFVPVGPIQRDTGASINDPLLVTAETSPLAGTRPTTKPLADAKERATQPTGRSEAKDLATAADLVVAQDDAGERDDPEATDAKPEAVELYCDRCGVPIPSRSHRPGAVRCAACRDKHGATTPGERKHRKLKPRERIEVSQEIRARVAADVVAERFNAAGAIEHEARQAQRIWLMKAEQAMRSPDTHAAIAARMDEQARKREALLTAREAALDAVDAASPVGNMPYRRPTGRAAGKSKPDLWKPPAKPDKIARETAAYVKGRKDARQRAQAWTVRPIAPSVTDRQKQALYLVEVEMLSYADGARRMGIAKRSFQELVEKARKGR